MSTSAEHKNEKVFEYYNYLPQEIRMMMIDEMLPDDRCRFTRCSKRSQKEAKASKKFIYALVLSVEFDHYIKLRVEHSDSYVEQHCGFVLHLNNVFDKKLRYCDFDGKEVWRMRLNQSTDICQLSLQMFESLLKNHQNTIRKLKLHGEYLSKNLKNVDLWSGIKQLTNLEAIEVHSGYDFRPILRKLRRPLKELTLYDLENSEDFANCNEIYQVRRLLHVDSLKLNNEQFLHLSASFCFLHIGKLTVRNVYDFILSWQHGQVRDNFQFCQWQTTGSNFNIKELFELFGVSMVDEGGSKSLMFTQLKAPFKTAELTYTLTRALVFNANIVTEFNPFLFFPM